MLTFGFILATSCVFIEMAIVSKNAGIRNFLIRHEMFGLVFSFLLSFFVGEVFGAHGIIALFAGIVSTVMTTIIYKIHLLHYVDKYEANKTAIDLKIKEGKELLVKNLKFWWKVFTKPIRFIIWIKNLIRIGANAASDFKNQLVDFYRRAKRAVIRG